MMNYEFFEIGLRNVKSKSFSLKRNLFETHVFFLFPSKESDLAIFQNFNDLRHMGIINCTIYKLKFNLYWKIYATSNTICT